MLSADVWIFLWLAVFQVRSEMAAKRVLVIYRLDKAAFDYVIGEIHAKFMSSKVRWTETLYCAVLYCPVLCCCTCKISRMTGIAYHSCCIGRAGRRWWYRAVLLS